MRLFQLHVKYKYCVGTIRQHVRLITLPLIPYAKFLWDPSVASEMKQVDELSTVY